MIHLEVAFPQAEESLDAPAQLVFLRDFFGGQVITIGAIQLIFAVNTVSDKWQLFLGQVGSLDAKQNHRGVKDDTSQGDDMLSENN